MTPENKKGVWVCAVCGYEYNEEEIPFEKLPADWICPLCGVSKEQFQYLED